MNIFQNQKCEYQEYQDYKLDYLYSRYPWHYFLLFIFVSFLKNNDIVKNFWYQIVSWYILFQFLFSVIFMLFGPKTWAKACAVPVLRVAAGNRVRARSMAFQRENWRQHSVAVTTICAISAWHLPKVLIRKSAIHENGQGPKGHRNQRNQRRQRRQRCQGQSQGKCENARVQEWQNKGW